MMNLKEKDALEGMLIQFGTNYALHAVIDACKVLGHPQTEWGSHREREDDCCYCRRVVYSKKEAKRRIKLKLAFIDKSAHNPS